MSVRRSRRQRLITDSALRFGTVVVNLLPTSGVLYSGTHATARNLGGQVDFVVDTGVDFDALYASHWHGMVRLAMLLVDDRASAEDVVQDAFVAMQGKTLRQPDAAVGYVRTAVVNGARSVLRRRGTARKYLPAFVTPDGGEVCQEDELLLAADEHADLIRALRCLPRRQREVLVLRFWSGLLESDIASTLGISVGTVKSSISRGLDALEASMGGAR